MTEHDGIEVVPWDNDTHEQASVFCRHFLANPGDLDRKLLRAAWIAREGRRILGVTGIISRVEIPVFRSIDERASLAMADRLNSYFQGHGFRGQDVLLFMSESEKPESRCPNREALLNLWGAKPAERYVLSVK